MQNLVLSNDSANVTLVCEDKAHFKAHKFDLIACSSIFTSILSDLPRNEHSVIYLEGVFAPEITSLLHFMYLGQATLFQNRIYEFLSVVKSFEIRNLCKEEVNDEADFTQKDGIQETNNPKTDDKEVAVDDNKEIDNPQTYYNKAAVDAQRSQENEPACCLRVGKLIREDNYN